MIALSSNHFSVDDQIADVISYLSLSDIYIRTMEDEFTSEFPEYNSLVWSGSWVDTEASGVDADYMSWVADWLEAHTPVMWSDGEPYLIEEDDDKPHEGHWSTFGTYWCDTCNSPYCDLA